MVTVAPDVLEADTSHDDTDRMHGAHLDCQREAPFVVTICGLAMDWAERAPRGADPAAECAECWTLERCPLCGGRLRR